MLYAQTPDAAGKFRLAQALEQAGEYDKASAIYRELSTREPGNFIYFDALQRTLVQLKRYDEAIALVSGRLAQQPGDVMLHTALAGIYQGAGQEANALAEWERALAIAPQNPNQYRIVAASLIEHRLLERAAEIYRRGRTACNDPFLFTMELAQLLSVMMDYEGATGELVAWLRKNPSQVAYVQGRLASFSTKPDGRRAATAVVERELRRQDDVRLEELLAWLHLEGKEFARALELYRDLDRRTNAQGMALLGFANRAAAEGALEVAVEAYGAAIAAPLPPPKLPAARYGEANALSEIAAGRDSAQTPLGNPSRFSTVPPERFAPALAAYRRITTDFPRSEFAAKAFYRIGVIQMERLFDLDAALASFQRAGEQAGIVRVILHDVELKEGMIFEAKGDTTRAAERFTRVARAPDATPDQADEAQFRLAEIACFGARFDDAVALTDSIALNLKADYANDALELASFLQENAPNATAALAQFGAAEFLARQRKNTEAIARFRQAALAAPGTPLARRAMMRVAALEEEMGNPLAAVATYQELLASADSTGRDRIRLSLAEAYEFGLREKPQAVEQYNTLLAESPSSIYAGIARRRIRQLRGDAL
jgi:cellulose synthase operon protein C